MMITSIDQLLDVMDDSKKSLVGNNDDDDDDDKLVVIKYYASYCKICQRAGIQFKKIATEYPNNKVQFAKIEASVLGGSSSGGNGGNKNRIIQQHHTVSSSTTAPTDGSTTATTAASSADTLRSLGVTKFPFVQIYRKGLCVASFSTGPSHLFVKKVRDTIDLCLERTPDVWDSYANEFCDEIQSNQRARHALRRATVMDEEEEDGITRIQQKSSYLDWTRGDSAK